MTAGGSSIPAVQRLLAVLAAGRRAAEAGTAFGEGAAAIASTAASLVTVELDPERAAVAAERLSGFPNAELLVGDWHDLLPRRAPYEFLFLDSTFKRQPEEDGPLAVSLLAPGGLLVADDFTPNRPGPDPAREFLFAYPELVATELLTTPETAAIVAARR